MARGLKWPPNDGAPGPMNALVRAFGLRRFSIFFARIFAGPQASGRWMGMQNSVANASGMVAPVVTGYLVQQTGNYSMALLVSAVVGLIGLVAWLVVLPRVEPIDWSADSALRARTAH